MKSLLTDNIPAGKLVAPFAGAGIEIVVVLMVLLGVCGRPLRGGGN